MGSVMSRNWMKWAVPLASVLGLPGCGGDDTWVYDVTLDAAALANVPTECTGEGVPPEPGPANLAPEQRWLIGKEQFNSTSLEVPDVDYTLPGVSISLDEDDAADVVMGTSLESGPFQFVGVIRTDPASGGVAARRVLQFVIQDDVLDDDIRGYVWVRREWLSYEGGETESVGECISTIPFTGRRVKE
jgi:hypothetical protein